MIDWDQVRQELNQQLQHRLRQLGYTVQPQPNTDHAAQVHRDGLLLGIVKLELAAARAEEIDRVLLVVTRRLHGPGIPEQEPERGANDELNTMAEFLHALQAYDYHNEAYELCDPTMQQRLLADTIRLLRDEPGN